MVKASRAFRAWVMFLCPLLSLDEILSFHLLHKISLSRPHVSLPTNIQRISRPTTGDMDLFMCICIDCGRVTNCQAYYFVEQKHGQPHMNNDPSFSPRDGSPTIHVNIRTKRDAEVSAMWRENVIKEIRVEGSSAYDMAPVTTIEYDVVACEDFMRDRGCWVRNMPQEIKDINPNFVPT
jgi:hypothetical protein